jgi:hypothetical protein
VGTRAHWLAPSGKRVLLLERGDYLPRERDNPPEANYYVGGNTKFCGAALFRLRPQDFAEIRHHGLSPEWPIDYDAMEPRPRSWPPPRCCDRGGVEAPLLAKSLATATGATQDRAGRIVVGPDPTIPGLPDQGGPLMRLG